MVEHKHSIFFFSYFILDKTITANDFLWASKFNKSLSKINKKTFFFFSKTSFKLFSLWILRRNSQKSLDYLTQMKNSTLETIFLDKKWFRWVSMVGVSWLGIKSSEGLERMYKKILKIGLKVKILYSEKITFY